MTAFISLDVESLDKAPFEIVALAAHFYSNDTLKESTTLKRSIQTTQNTWFNQNVLPGIQTFENNYKNAKEIYSKFLEFYVQNSSQKSKNEALGLVTYCSYPYEQFVINYLEYSLGRDIPHFDIYQEYPRLFSRFSDLEKYLLKHNKLPQEQSRHNPVYDAKITGETFICIKKSHLL